jgi:hypothetical protein
MTEAEWLACEDPWPMLGFVRGEERNPLPERRSRLFGVACCRRLLHLIVDSRSLKALEVTERYADGAATTDELDAAYSEAFDVEAYYAEHPDRRHGKRLEALGRAANAVAGGCHEHELAEGVALEALTAADAADITDEAAAQANLVRDIFGNPFRPVAFSPEWRTHTAVSLARRMYESREFSAMPILADALEDAGCDSEGVLNHCRGPGSHARGCWVVDLILAKEPIRSTAGTVGGQEAAELVRFRPSRAEGLPDVREVVVRPDRLEVNTAGLWVTFPFSRIGRRQESRLVSFVKRLAGRSPWPMLVADRDWFHPPPARFFLWYTDPPLRTCMPDDEPAEYAASYFYRIQSVIRSGGYATFDLG